MHKLFTKLNISILAVALIGVTAVVWFNLYSANTAGGVHKAPFEHEKLDANLNHFLEASPEDKQQLLEFYALPGEAEPPAGTDKDSRATNRGVSGNIDLNSVASEPSPAVEINLSEPNKSKETTALVEFLKANRAEILFHDADVGYIEAKVPISVLVEISERTGVEIIRTLIPPTPDTNVTSQGVAAHGVNDWKNDLGATGEGVKVGVIDAGFEGVQDLMGNELPNTIEALCRSGSGTSHDIDDCENGEDHGTAVAEAVIDIAPDVDLYIAPVNSSGEMHDAVEWMVEEGVDVINMSLSYSWDGPGDGESPKSYSPLKAVDKAVTGGIVWFNSCLLYTSPSPRDRTRSRMPSSA